MPETSAKARVVLKVVILGGTGLLGESVGADCLARGLSTVHVASTGGDYRIDLRDHAALMSGLDELDGDLIVNCAAITSIQHCEENPAEAWAVNALPASVIAQWCRRHDRKFIQISSDHFFCGEQPVGHSETEPVTLVNEYARSKYAGEGFAGENADALIVRTVFLGLTGKRRTYLFWLAESLRRNDELILFEDAFFSPAHVSDVSKAIVDLALKDVRGVINVAGSDVTSKADFVRRMAARMGCKLLAARSGSVCMLTPRRGNSLGLNVTRAEACLDRKLPSLDETIEVCVRQLKAVHQSSRV